LHPLVPGSIAIYGYIYDVKNGRVIKVSILWLRWDMKEYGEWRRIRLGNDGVGSSILSDGTIISTS
jgi:hypothetical protein